jgi:hypothetical protein
MEHFERVRIKKGGLVLVQKFPLQSKLRLPLPLDLSVALLMSPSSASLATDSPFSSRNSALPSLWIF